MANKSVDRTAMANAALLIEAKHQQIHRLQAKLQDQMTALSYRWSGPASTTFQRDYSQFDTELEKIKQGLDKIHTSLVETQRQSDRRRGGDDPNG